MAASIRAKSCASCATSRTHSAYAHDHGIIHRDVKAENILIEGATGRSLVTDFGIARLAEASPLTSTGQVLGTVYYLSPEQVSGDAVDARSDIYSLGVVGFFALSGRFPFDAELASAVLIAHVTKTPPPLHTVAPRLSSRVGRSHRPMSREGSTRSLSDGSRRRRRTGCDRRHRRGSDRLRASNHHCRRGPALISDTEAQAIFGRAAELQAMTGVVPRQAPVPVRRDSASDAARTSGFKPADVRDAAVEAGIDARTSTTRSRSEGLHAPARRCRDQLSSSIGVATNWAAGSPTRLEFEVVVDGEMPERRLRSLVDHIRHATGESGPDLVGGTLVLVADAPRPATDPSVGAFTRRARRRFVFRRHLSEPSEGSSAASSAALAAGHRASGSSSPREAHSRCSGSACGSRRWARTYLTAAGDLRPHRRKRADELRALAEAIGAQARESIAAGEAQAAWTVGQFTTDTRTATDGRDGCRSSRSRVLESRVGQPLGS